LDSAATEGYGIGYGIGDTESSDQISTEGMKRQEFGRANAREVPTEQKTVFT
jgi:hypothetical protein